MDANMRDYGTHAKDALKQATGLLKTFNLTQRDIAQALDVSFGYFTEMLCGQKPVLHKHATALLALVQKTVAHKTVLTGQQVGLLMDTAGAWCDALAGWHQANLGPETDEFLAWLEKLPEDQQRKTGQNYRNARDREIMEVTKQAAQLKGPWLTLWLYLACRVQAGASTAAKRRQTR